MALTGVRRSTCPINQRDHYSSSSAPRLAPYLTYANTPTRHLTWCRRHQHASLCAHPLDAPLLSRLTLPRALPHARIALHYKRAHATEEEEAIARRQWRRRRSRNTRSRLARSRPTQTRCGLDSTEDDPHAGAVSDQSPSGGSRVPGQHVPC